MAEATAGWYPDPGGDDQTFRWWTGTAWSDRLSNDEDAPAPGPGEVLRRIAPRRARRRRWPAVVISTVALIAVVVAVVAIGSWRAEPAPTRTAIPTDPAPTAPRPWSIDGQGLIHFGDIATMRLPAAPFPANPRVEDQYGLLDTGMVIQTLVEQPNWYAAIDTGAISDEATASTAALVAVNVADFLHNSGYDGLDPSLSRETLNPIGSLPQEQACRLTIRFSYTKKGIESRYDDVTIIVIRTDPGHYATWAALVPERTPTKVRAAVDASLDSLTFS